MKDQSIGNRIECIGKGLTSKVYLYSNPKTRKLFAVKSMYKTDPHKTYKEFKLECSKEYEISQLLHQGGRGEHLGKIHGVKHDSVLKFDSRAVHLVMDYYPVTLLEFINRRPKIPEKLSVFKQIVKGVHDLHSLKVCHRDLKIDNICFDSEGTLKIIDFGTCKMVSGDELCMGVCGTDPFISPSANSNLRYDGFKNDTWSLGIILYILACKPDVESAGTDTARRDLVKGSNSFSNHLKYPWNSLNGSDPHYQAYRLHEVEVEKRELEGIEDELIIQYNKVIIEQKLDPTPVLVKSLSFVNHLKEDIDQIEAGIFRLLRNLDENLPLGSWATMSKLLKLDPKLHVPVEQVLESEWMQNIDKDSLMKGMALPALIDKKLGKIKS